MQWDNATDLILIGEVILANVFQTRKGTAARGNTWKAVAAAMRERGFDVDARALRAVRDRFTLLKNKVKQENRKEKAPSGIAVEETDEEKSIREAIEDMMQEEEEDIELSKQKGDEEKKKSEGAEMRERACETYGETRQR